MVQRFKAELDQGDNYIVLGFHYTLFLTAAGCPRKGFYPPPQKFGTEKSYQSAIN